MNKTGEERVRFQEVPYSVRQGVGGGNIGKQGELSAAADNFQVTQLRSPFYNSTYLLPLLLLMKQH